MAPRVPPSTCVGLRDSKSYRASLGDHFSGQPRIFGGERPNELETSKVPTDDCSCARPSYAPDLNPTEQVWNHGKYSDLANFIPDNIEHLEAEVTKSFEGQRENHELLQSFFTHAGLEL